MQPIKIDRRQPVFYAIAAESCSTKANRNARPSDFEQAMALGDASVWSLLSKRASATVAPRNCVATVRSNRSWTRTLASSRPAKPLQDH